MNLITLLFSPALKLQKLIVTYELLGWVCRWQSCESVDHTCKTLY